MVEIGSEFWTPPVQTCDKRYFLSGRTSLEYIVRDIIAQKAATSVLLPSYCCHTMIEPFVRHGFSIRFYDVFFSKEKKCICAELPSYQENEILYYLSYFGFSPIWGLNLDDLRAKYQIIIDDRTHSWLRMDKNSVQPDYSFTSFRKWGAFSGISEACKYKDSFLPAVGEKSSKQYIFLRDEAYGLKKAYIDHGGEKDRFLRLFHEAEELLEEDYVDYRPSYHAIESFLSADWDIVRNSRRKNAQILLEGLSNVQEIDLPFTELKDEDAPLFVPILVKKDRNQLRKHLIDQLIYCPVHWPITDLHRLNENTSYIYQHELSLICDQRYTEDDMLHMCEVIRRGIEEC